MTKYVQILIIFFILSACGQNAIEMKTLENANEKFAEFIEKKKFIEKKLYPEPSERLLRLIS